MGQRLRCRLLLVGRFFSCLECNEPQQQITKHALHVGRRHTVCALAPGDTACRGSQARLLLLSLTYISWCLPWRLGAWREPAQHGCDHGRRKACCALRGSCLGSPGRSPSSVAHPSSCGRSPPPRRPTGTTIASPESTCTQTTPSTRCDDIVAGALPCQNQPRPHSASPAGRERACAAHPGASSALHCRARPPWRSR